MEHKDFVMPFGKYKDDKLGDIGDLLYLDYVLGFDDLFENTKKHIAGYLADPPVARELDRLIREKEEKDD
jgi:hypothetical protein